MGTVFVLIIVAALLFYGYVFFKGANYVANESEFRQAGIIVNFRQQNITIKNNTYKVAQVTGIRMEAFTSSHKHGESVAKTVYIEIDDFKKPHHKIMFLTKGHARKFMQRLSTALRRAGGPDFV